jgi:hypothetical protein
MYCRKPNVARRHGVAAAILEMFQERDDLRGSELVKIELNDGLSMIL